MCYVRIGTLSFVLMQAVCRPPFSVGLALWRRNKNIRVDHVAHGKRQFLDHFCSFVSTKNKMKRNDDVFWGHQNRSCLCCVPKLVLALDWLIKGRTKANYGLPS